MTTLEKRAKSYAMQVGCFRPDLCAADYIAGAKEERILIIEKACEWLLENLYDHPSEQYLICTESFDCMEEMVEQFMKAMKEE